MLTVGAKQQTALLATNSRPLAVGLTALLLSIPPIDNVICVNEAAELLDGLAVAQPALIFLDTALAENGVCELSKSAHRLAPHAQVVILSENMAEFRDLLHEMRDTVVVKGTDPARLAGIIESLLEGHAVA